MLNNTKHNKDITISCSLGNQLYIKLYTEMLMKQFENHVSYSNVLSQNFYNSLIWLLMPTPIFFGLFLLHNFK